MRLIPSLLWIDAIGGLSVGVFVLLLSPWLSTLYALPLPFVVVMGLANLLYGCFSFSLVRRPIRPRGLLLLLIGANAIWAVLCGVAAVALRDSASIFGIGTLVLECLFVGGLAALEWRHREALHRAPVRHARPDQPVEA